MSNGEIDLRALGPYRLRLAVDDDLRRIDLPVASRTAVSFLAGSEGRLRKSVLPAQIVPVVDMPREQDQRRIARHLGQKPVGWRRERTSLAGEELDHCPRLRVRL